MGQDMPKPILAVVLATLAIIAAAASADAIAYAWAEYDEATGEFICKVGVGGDYAKGFVASDEPHTAVVLDTIAFEGGRVVLYAVHSWWREKDALPESRYTDTLFGATVVMEMGGERTEFTLPIAESAFKELEWKQSELNDDGGGWTAQFDITDTPLGQHVLAENPQAVHIRLPAIEEVKMDVLLPAIKTLSSDTVTFDFARLDAAKRYCERANATEDDSGWFGF